MPSLAAQAILLQTLHASLQAICPIQGVSVADWANVPTTTTIWFATAVTPAQVSACNSFLATFVPPLTVSSPVSFPAFISLFTVAERASLFGSADVKIREWIAVSSSRGFVNMSETSMKNGLDYLVAQGIITAARETAILSSSVIN